MEKDKNVIKLQKFFYKDKIYYVDETRLRSFENEYNFNLKSLSSSKNILDFMKTKQISLIGFLEFISVCWTQF
ncbi:MAG: hypothetical protein E7Z91_01100 [Cyanobacteria bacterium SIG30]|nr:hypothetical protein [Cyanobacteria bacterium SIG30]